MCELLGMSSNEAATVNLSLTKLAEHSGPPSSIRDGWGVAYFEGSDIRLIKDAAPAADSDWLRFIEAHEIRSQVVMAHIRKATMGERTYRNAQPFTRELGGRMHAFAHNGWLPHIADSSAFQTAQFKPIGETDSERAFCALMERLRALWGSCALPALVDRISMISEFAADLRLLGPSNFLYSDGDALFAHGDRRKQSSGEVKSPGLVFIERSCPLSGSEIAASGISVSGADQHIALFASVPLTGEVWTPLQEGEVIAASAGRIQLRSKLPTSV